MVTVLKKLRLNSGQTQGALAQKLCISRPYLGLVENGRLLPSPVVIEKLEDIFDLPIEELLEPVEEKRLMWKASINKQRVGRY